MYCFRKGDRVKSGSLFVYWISCIMKVTTEDPDSLFEKSFTKFPFNSGKNL